MGRTDSETDPTVLVAEDEQSLAKLYAGYLADHYDVRLAYDGPEALDAFDETVDAVILDRRMPRMGGDEVLERLREQGSSCPVAMVTAVDPDFDIVSMGFDEYVVKPVSEDQLVELVDQLLARTSYDERLRRHYAVASKVATLEAHKSEAELADSDEYADLQAEMARLDEALVEDTADMSNEDFGAILRGG